nr:MAG TPA: hypothetical protein [Caudoviricetes sp.]
MISCSTDFPYCYSQHYPIALLKIVLEEIM